MTNLIRRHKIFFGIITLLIVVTLPLIVIQVQTQQQLKQRASEIIPDASVVLMPPSTPDANPLKINDEFSIKIGINNPSSLDISAVDIRLTYPANLLSYMNFEMLPTPSTNGSAYFEPLIVTMPGTNPGNIHIVAANPTAKVINVSSIDVINLRFKAINNGIANVVFSPDAMVTAFGRPGTLNLIFVNGTYTIRTPTIITPTPTPTPTPISTVTPTPSPTPTPTPTRVPTPTPTPDPNLCRPAGDQYVYGDVNRDIIVNSADALLVAKHLVGTVTLTGNDFVRADVNGDTAVNSSDLLLIKKYLVRTITTFPVCTATPTPTPSPTPTGTPTPTPVPTGTPTPTPPVCPLKSQGDANCDGLRDIFDSRIWRLEFIDESKGIVSLRRSNFNNDNSIDVFDYRIWRLNVR